MEFSKKLLKMKSTANAFKILFVQLIFSFYCVLSNIYYSCDDFFRVKCITACKIIKKDMCWCAKNKIKNENICKCKYRLECPKFPQ